MRDHRLERHEPPAGVDEPVEALGHLHAREALVAVVRVGGDHAQRQREPGDVGERLSGPDRQRREHRVDLLREACLEAGQLLLGAVLDGPDLDAVLGECGSQLALPEA